MSTQEKLQEFATIDDLNETISNIIHQELLTQKESVQILEAGCGSLSHIRTGDRCQLTGIDISQKQLDRHPHLTERILGDIQTYRFQPSSYDMIACFWVLEHVDTPELALKNFVEAIREGGIIVIGVPNVMSLKGLVTKYTPHWFHIFMYRYIYKYELAGIDDNPPFHTTLRFSISPDSILKFAEENNLSATYFKTFEDYRQEELRKKLKISNQLLNSLDFFLNRATFKRIQLKSTSYFVILQKNKHS